MLGGRKPCCSNQLSHRSVTGPVVFVRLYVGRRNVLIGGNVRFSKSEDVLRLGLVFLPCKAGEQLSPSFREKAPTASLINAPSSMQTTGGFDGLNEVYFSTQPILNLIPRIRIFLLA